MRCFGGLESRLEERLVILEKMIEVLLLITLYFGTTARLYVEVNPAACDVYPWDVKRLMTPSHAVLPLAQSISLSEAAR